jgi:hypothetical protein
MLTTLALCGRNGQGKRLPQASTERQSSLHWSLWRQSSLAKTVSPSAPRMAFSQRTFCPSKEHPLNVTHNYLMETGLEGVFHTNDSWLPPVAQSQAMNMKERLFPRHQTCHLLFVDAT